MKKIIVFVLFFYSSFLYAAAQWETTFRSNNKDELTAYCDSSFPNTPHKIITENPGQSVPVYACQTNSQPCDAPLRWDNYTSECATPCETISLGTKTTHTHGFLTCVGNCAVIQTSDSNCVGDDSTGYCTADYAQTGDFCPSQSNQPETCTSGCGNQNSSGSHSSSGSGNPGMPDPEGGTSGGGGNSGGSSSSASGGNNNGGNGGGNSGSVSSNGLTQSQLDESLNKLFGVSASGGDCASPPTCTSSSSAICQAMLQEYYLRCPVTKLNQHGDGKYDGTGHSLDLNARLADAKNRYKNKIEELQNNFRQQFHASVSGGGSLNCPTYVIFGVNVIGGFCVLSPLLDRLGGLFPAIASILAAYILLRRE